jgi:ABC-type glycerol-3-phosphate transport system substrate-binding protein
MRPDDPPTPFVPDAMATTQVLNFFKRARDQNLLPENAISLKTADEVWSSFAAGQAPLAQVSASRYLADRDKIPNTQFALVPTRDGKTATLASGWAFAVITNDPARQAAIARFVPWFIQGERLAPWLRAAHHLPTSRATIPLAVEPAEYAAFLREAMERATFVSLASPRNAKVATAWRAAIAAVWKGQLTPEDAARSIAAAAK